MAKSNAGTYEDYGKPGDSSSVWQYFQREVAGQSAKCKECSKILKTVGGSTKGLHTHLKTKHNKDLLKRNATSASSAAAENKPRTSASSKEEDVEFKQKEKKQKITDYFHYDKNEKTLPATLSRMTARDGLPFRVFCSSPDLRAALQDRGFSNLPQSPNSVKKLVMEYSSKLRSHVLRDIIQMKAQECKFSLSFDEWTSTRNRRFMNINVHSGNKFWNLGLIRILGSMPAEKCVQLLEEKLKQHGLSLADDIVCIVTDGASVMMKVGRLIKAEQQLCLAHGIQLAVVDVLYKKQFQEESAVDTEGDILEDDLNEDIEEGGEEEMETFELDSGFAIEQGACENDIERELSDDLGPLIQKVRKVVRIFKNSPTKNDDILQPYVRAELSKELSLVCDTKTRWNSLVDMLQRFLKLRNPIEKSLIDLKNLKVQKALKINFSEEEFTQISDIVSVLEPVKLTVEALCREDASLLSADAALKFMLRKVEIQNSKFSREMLKALCYRIQQRRTEYSSLLQYLHNPSWEDAFFMANSCSAVIRDSFSVLSNTSIRKQVQLLVERLSQSGSEDVGEVSAELAAASEPSIAPVASSSTSNMKEEINEAIKATLEVKPTPKRLQHRENILTVIKKEMNLFEGGGSRGKYLQLAYTYLFSIPPTSVEAERAFSAAGVLNSKLRSRMNDNTLDNLCFLRAFFRDRRQVLHSSQGTRSGSESRPGMPFINSQ